MENAIQSGAQLGDEFEIAKVLSHGGFGITYKVRALKEVAESIDEGGVFVVKECFPGRYVTRAADGMSLIIREGADRMFAECRDSFFREAEVLARFRNPNIVRVFLVRRSNSTGYIVMEFIDGVSFSDYLDEYAKNNDAYMSYRDLEPYARKLVRALQEIHEADIVHLDIKPGNIMLRGPQEPVLIDFGGAKVQSDLGGMVVGTPGFAPFDQMSGRNIGPTADIYGLAATFYSALTGSLPRRPLDETLKTWSEFKPLAELAREQNLDIPAEFAAAIDRALAEDFNDRPASAWKWYRDMFPPSRPAPPPPVEPEPPEPPKAGFLRRTSTIVAELHTTPRGRLKLVGLALVAAAIMLAVMTLLLVLFSGVSDGQQISARQTYEISSVEWTAIDLGNVPAKGKVGFTANGRFRARIDGALYAFVDGDAVELPEIGKNSHLEVKAEDGPLEFVVLY